jgi:hypothetical protein
VLPAMTISVHPASTLPELYGAKDCARSARQLLLVARDRDRNFARRWSPCASASAYLEPRSTVGAGGRDERQKGTTSGRLAVLLLAALLYGCGADGGGTASRRSPNVSTGSPL